ncbi:MAG: hypothetical protein ACRDTC_15690 [Pseudonocardiaceae bacterium]
MLSAARKQPRGVFTFTDLRYDAVPDAETIEAVLREVKRSVEVRHRDHRYSFGTHATAQRREVSEYLFIGR